MFQTFPKEREWTSFKSLKKCTFLDKYIPRKSLFFFDLSFLKKTLIIIADAKNVKILTVCCVNGRRYYGPSFSPPTFLGGKEPKSRWAIMHFEFATKNPGGK